MENLNEKQQIEEMAKVLCEDCARDFAPCSLNKVGRMCDSVREQAKAFYNADYRKQEWISVEERLPEEKVNCLVHYKHAYCDNDGYWGIGVSFYDGHEFHIGAEYKVTHWMPLPEAPKMKGDSDE